MTITSPLLLYDGTCGFCTASVRFILAHERRQSLCFASLQGHLASTIRANHPEVGAIDSIVWVEHTPDGGHAVQLRSAAALRVARYLGGVWRLSAVGYLVPAVVRDYVYDMIAKHRHQLFAASSTCIVPSPAMRHRFLD
jgi:predicted DCC family thiol-disulfide oxidoreductase YuxK